MAWLLLPLLEERGTQGKDDEGRLKWRKNTAGRCWSIYDAVDGSAFDRR